MARKKVCAAFDGGLISSDGGFVLLREAERRLRLAETLAGCSRDRRNQVQVVHSLAAMLRFRMLAIACSACSSGVRSHCRSKSERRTRRVRWARRRRCVASHRRPSAAAG
ncbi:MAG: transposase [Alphaproteobacteria bacterium]|nr:transposase [Alphaproteobacteria bacterium]